MKNKIPTIIIVILAIAVIGLVAYIFFGHHGNGDFRYEEFKRPYFGNMGNFSLTDEMKNATIAFFDSSPSIENAKTYCEQNRVNCFYYCREINPDNEVCKELSRPSGMWRGNFSRGGQ